MPTAGIALKTILIFCLEAGINVEGINAEVAAGQWDFQVFAKEQKKLEMRLGWLDTFWSGRQKDMVTLSTGSQNL